MKTCAVIGSGIAGLASALRAKKKGYDVTVYERNGQPGGKVNEWGKNDYRFDLGPSVFTLPELIDELFTLFDKNPRDYFEYTQLDPSFNYFYEDGTVIRAHSDINLFAKEIEDKTCDSAEQVHRYLKDVARIYDITNEVFIEQSLHIATNFLKVKALSGVLRFRHIHAFETMNETNKRFFNDPKNIQLFNYYATYVGSNPLVAPATLNVIQHLEINLGTYMCTSGMYGVVRALYQLSEDIGIKFQFNTEVERIIVHTKKAVGILVNQREIPFDAIISNMDIHHTYENLLPGIKQPKRILNQERSNSVIVLNWAVKKEFADLGVHNIFFSANRDEEYQAISDRNSMSDDPSVYLYISSKISKNDAPSGCENWFLLVSVPHDSGQDWDSIVKRATENCKSKINRMLAIDIASHIEFEHSLSPKEIANHYFAFKGAVFGNSANSRYAAFLRHPNFKRSIKNLYFAGGTVHPGAGIPMCLNSAKIVEGLL